MVRAEGWRQKLITVADILSLPAFEKIELLAPIDGAGSQRIYNVGILDCPPSINGYEAYMPGEFILTNLGFCYGDPELSDASLIAMIERRVAAIAVKKVYSPCFTDAVAEASLRCGVPVYLYSGAYHERVAYQSLDLLQKDLAASDKSDAIDALLEGVTREHIRHEVNRLAGLTGAAMRCVAISAEKDDRCSLYAIQDTLNDFLDTFQSDNEEVESAAAFCYHDSLLVFISYCSKDGASRLNDDFRRAVGSIGVVHCGVGDLVPLGEADVSIRQAVTLLAEAHVRDVRELMWADLSMDAFSFAVRANPLFAHTVRDFKSVLEEHDKNRGSELVETAFAFTRTFGSIADAAQLMHQHPNTVRYRLKRIRTLLNMEDAGERELLTFLTLLFLS